MLNGNRALGNPYSIDEGEVGDLPQGCRPRSRAVRRSLALGAVTAGLGALGAGAASADDLGSVPDVQLEVQALDVLGPGAHRTPERGVGDAPQSEVGGPEVADPEPVDDVGSFDLDERPPATTQPFGGGSDDTGYSFADGTPLRSELASVGDASPGPLDLGGADGGVQPTEAPLLASGGSAGVVVSDIGTPALLAGAEGEVVVAQVPVAPMRPPVLPSRPLVPPPGGPGGPGGPIAPFFPPVHREPFEQWLRPEPLEDPHVSGARESWRAPDGSYRVRTSTGQQIRLSNDEVRLINGDNVWGYARLLPLDFFTGNGRGAQLREFVGDVTDPGRVGELRRRIAEQGFDSWAATQPPSVQDVLLRNRGAVEPLLTPDAAPSQRPPSTPVRPRSPAERPAGEPDGEVPVPASEEPPAVEIEPGKQPEEAPTGLFEIGTGITGDAPTEGDRRGPTGSWSFPPYRVPQLDPETAEVLTTQPRPLPSSAPTDPKPARVPPSASTSGPEDPPGDPEGDDRPADADHETPGEDAQDTEDDPSSESFGEQLYRAAVDELRTTDPAGYYDWLIGEPVEFGPLTQEEVTEDVEDIDALSTDDAAEDFFRLVDGIFADLDARRSDLPGGGTDGTDDADPEPGR